MPWVVRGQDGSFDQVAQPEAVQPGDINDGVLSEATDIVDTHGLPKKMLPKVSLFKFEPPKSLVNQALNG